MRGLFWVVSEVMWMHKFANFDRMGWYVMGRDGLWGRGGQFYMIGAIVSRHELGRLEFIVGRAVECIERMVNRLRLSD